MYLNTQVVLEHLYTKMAFDGFKIGEVGHTELSYRYEVAALVPFGVGEGK